MDVQAGQMWATAAHSPSVSPLALAPFCPTLVSPCQLCPFLPSPFFSQGLCGREQGPDPAVPGLLGAPQLGLKASGPGTGWEG